MEKSNVNPIFQPILNSISPKAEPKDAFSQLEAMHRASLRANTALLEGYSNILASLNIEGTTKQTIREISAKATQKAYEEMKLKS